MKKGVVTMLLMGFALCSFAQTKTGRISIYPRIGTSISNLTGYETGISTDMEGGNTSTLKSNFKAGFTAGAEAEYQMTPMFSLSLGVMYTMLGAKYTDHTTLITTAYHGIEQNISSATSGSYYGIGGHHVNLQYIDIPLMVNVYVCQGLALKAGVQAGFLLDASAKFDETSMSKTVKDGVTTITHGTTESFKYKVNDMFNKFDFSIPVGISYEYMNVKLDARYNFGLTKAFNYTGAPDSKNNFLTVTFGYRFEI